MPFETKGSAYAAMVAEAEAAVAAVKDPELRYVAFDIILTALLGSKSARPALPDTRHAARRPTASAADKTQRKGNGGNKCHKRNKEN